MRDDAARKPFTAVVVDARGPDEHDSLLRARSALKRWRRAGLEVAVVCSRRGSHALPDHDLFEVVIDESADLPALDATVRLLGEATLRLDTAPLDSLAVAHTVASVSAARALGFRRIVGVEREGDGPELLESGARSVVDDLLGLRFPRLLPAALDCLPEIEAWQDQRSLALFLDFDGTLAPIVAHPDQARLEPAMFHVLQALAERHTVAVISGRDRADVARRVGLGHIYYAGSHGLDIAGPDLAHSPPGADEAVRRLGSAADTVAESVRDIPGAVIERKRYSVAVHFRQVTDSACSRRIAELVEQTASEAGLRVRRGKQVREIVPDLDWHKGRALTWMCETLNVEPRSSAVLYIGDDETDEDAFRALEPEGMGLRPGPRVAATLADYQLADVAAVQRFLEWLRDRPA